MVATISPTTLADLCRKGENVTLIDVRPPAEFGEVHVDFAHNIPLDADAQTAKLDTAFGLLLVLSLVVPVWAGERYFSPDQFDAVALLAPPPAPAAEPIAEEAATRGMKLVLADIEPAPSFGRRPIR